MTLVVNSGPSFREFVEDLLPRASWCECDQGTPTLEKRDKAPRGRGGCTLIFIVIRLRDVHEFEISVLERTGSL